MRAHRDGERDQLVAQRAIPRSCRMDTVGNKVAAKEIAMIKVAAPNNCCKVIDWAIQAHGAGGFSQD